MNYRERREKVYSQMEEKSILILYSGEALHISADAYHHFEANRQFFYLTGIRRENMALVLEKCGEKLEETLYIEPVDPSVERWVGKKMTEEEAKEISGVEAVAVMDSLPSALDRIMTRKLPKKVYFDTYRHQMSDLPDYNAAKAQAFISAYPGIAVESIYPAVAALRMVKDADEVALTKEAVKVTEEALNHVLATLKPGMMEYQVQAEFEYKVKSLGADGMAFPTIAGSGINGTMLHYETNHDVCKENTLVLLDLGARVKGYNADITRTYPVSGKFTERQKQFYNIVLKANRSVAEMAKPGLTLKELNDHCKSVLAEGLIGLGLIEKEEEVGKYYMHGVSHHLGIDVHDVTVPEQAKLMPGMIITDEPGLYIDEEEIGIRIEDDLLITEDGCEVLSESIVRTVEEIEAKMKER
ncbi:MAG: aminopeptidase P N-terminal domain-containing protein [Lachnospiraceae bacterium]|nr:aminopeptidase P N-terminal domain-containing protein [Lachnospiraceae bacterium]